MYYNVTALDHGRLVYLTIFASSIEEIAFKLGHLTVKTFEIDSAQ